MLKLPCSSSLPLERYTSLTAMTWIGSIAKYRREVGLPDSSNPQFRTMEFWRSEIEELRRSIDTLEARLKHLSGEDILALGMTELKQIERQLKIGVERVRSRKRRMVLDHATLLKRRLYKSVVMESLIEISYQKEILTCIWFQRAAQTIARGEHSSPEKKVRLSCALYITITKRFFKMKISLMKQIRSPTMTRYASVTSAACAALAYMGP
ncbi:hypothetical protein DITRI_Ditri04bG0021000 [Diplodiscus trichospermus]